MVRARSLAVFVLAFAWYQCRADTLELTDGTVLRNCFIRDEGTRLLVWQTMADVGSEKLKVFPRSRIKSYKVERDDAWDAKPKLPDLSVTYIEMSPKLAGLHGRVQYDGFGRPSIGGAPILSDIGDRKYERPQDIVKNLKLKYRSGEEVTLTAHIKNLGFAPSKTFDVVWLIDGTEVKRVRRAKALAEMQEAAFDLKWRWQDGKHLVTVRVLHASAEIATINNQATDPLWGWGFTYIVNKERIKAWHTARTGYGTFSFEDFYRWHIDIMNALFAASIYPSAPQGIIARVRLDRIIYTDDVDRAGARLFAEDGIRYDQGGWTWGDSPEEKANGWQPATKEWRNQTEWSLPHELGHQLGLTDLYGLDYAGTPEHVWADTKDPVAHFMNHPMSMMHWHGPNVFAEIDAGYLNMTWDKPRGHFGDYYFAIPRENYLRIVDINGRGVAGASVDIYQRGTVVAPATQPASDRGVSFFPVIEDGNFGQPVSKYPVIQGRTDPEGMLRLPNRPVQEVMTFNGFQRRANPFGNINVVGERGLLLVKVQKVGTPQYFWLEIADFNVAWFRGFKGRYVTVLKTPFGSADSPPKPDSVSIAPVDTTHARIRWTMPPESRERVYLDRVIGFRIYRRVSSDGLNDRPWQPIATLPPEARDFVANLAPAPDDLYWFAKTERFGVSAIGELSVESELAEVVRR